MPSWSHDSVQMDGVRNASSVTSLRASEGRGGSMGFLNACETLSRVI